MNVGKKEKINVLSLFDGMTCGRIALERAEIKINNYFASEIDKDAMIMQIENTSHKERQSLRMSLKYKWFEMTKAGIKSEDYREINDYWIKRLVDNVTLFVGRYDSMKNISVKEAGISNVNLLHATLDILKRDIKFKKFNCNIMTLGYPKATDNNRIIKLEHKGIEIRKGNPEWGAEPNKLYFVIMHGAILA